MRRTSSESSIANTNADKDRITSFGLFLRDHGLDELPQIFNIILGQINFIGPRSLHMNTYQHLEDDVTIDRAVLAKWQNKRQIVLTGLTGWQQIHQPSFTYDAWAGISYDLDYLENPSLARKIKIVVDSILIILIGKRSYFKQRS